MIFAYIFIIGLPAFLIYFIVKKIRKATYIKKHGVLTSAWITHIHTRRFHKGSMDILTLEYQDATGTRYPAKATVAVGQYRAGEYMRISYLAETPAQYAFDSGKGYWAILIFCILLLAFTIFASFKIHELAQAGNYHFTG